MTPVRLTRPFLLSGLLLAAAACSDSSRSFTLDRSSVAATSAAPRLRPLSVPPIIDLRPGRTESAAIDRTFRLPTEPDGPAGVSGGQAALLAAAGASAGDPAIRAALDAETRAALDQAQTVRRLLLAGDGSEAPQRAATIQRR